MGLVKRWKMKKFYFALWAGKNEATKRIEIQISWGENYREIKLGFVKYWASLVIQGLAKKQGDFVPGGYKAKRSID